MQIVETNKGFEISFPFDMAKVREVKKISGAWFNGASKVWTLPRRCAPDVDRLRKNMD
jgi:hypothetical protein